MMKEKKILLIEDEDFLVRPLGFALKKEDADLLVAKDGEQGVAMAGSFHPDLILLDLVLPKKNGFETLSEIKKNPLTENIPVLIVSNLAGESDMNRGLAGGASDYIVKANLSISSLLDKIRLLLEK